MTTSRSSSRHTNHRDQQQQQQVERISISLPPKLLEQFDKSMEKAGFKDRSKSIQTALHSFINENEWKSSYIRENGAGVIILHYDNHIYDQDTLSTHVQHQYNDVISAATHMHLKGDNCLESIMVKGNVKRIKELARSLSENRGIKSMKVHFISLI